MLRARLPEERRFTRIRRPRVDLPDPIEREFHPLFPEDVFPGQTRSLGGIPRLTPEQIADPFADIAALEAEPDILAEIGAGAGDAAVGGGLIADIGTAGIAVLVTAVAWAMAHVMRLATAPQRAAKLLRSENLANALADYTGAAMPDGTALTDAIQRQYIRYAQQMPNGALIQLPPWMITALSADLSNTVGLIQQNWVQLANLMQAWSQPSNHAAMMAYLYRQGFAVQNPYPPSGGSWNGGLVGRIIGGSSGSFLTPTGMGSQPSNPTSYYMYGSGKNQYWFDAWGDPHAPPLPNSPVYPIPPGLNPQELLAFFQYHAASQSTFQAFPSTVGGVGGTGADIAYAAPGMQFANVSENVDAYGNPLPSRRVVSLTNIPRQIMTGLLSNTSGPRLRVRARVPSNLSRPAKISRPFVFSNKVRKSYL